MKTKPRTVGILLFDGITALDLVGPADAFSSATYDRKDATGEPPYTIVSLGLSMRRCVAECGIEMRPSHTIDDAPPIDTLVIPGGRGLREPKINRRAAEWIAARAPKIRRIATVCTGIYGLAPTGLLDGRRVTTHWNFAADVATRFPKLEVSADDLFIKDDRFYTSAGVTAGIDLSLALIEEDLGASAALRVARELVVHMRREGGQEQFSEPLRFQTSSPERLSDLCGFIAAHLGDDLSVDALAHRMAISPRQLTRQCQGALGCSPAALVQRMRLEEAKSRLLRRAATIEQVAASVGFRSADAFRRAFDHKFGISPSTYRSRFAMGAHTARTVKA